MVVGQAETVQAVLRGIYRVLGEGPPIWPLAAQAWPRPRKEVGAGQQERRSPVAVQMFTAASSCRDPYCNTSYTPRGCSSSAPCRAEGWATAALEPTENAGCATKCLTTRGRWVYSVDSLRAVDSRILVRERAVWPCSAAACQSTTSPPPGCPSPLAAACPGSGRRRRPALHRPGEEKETRLCSFPGARSCTPAAV
jgi:hypothetical protein